MPSTCRGTMVSPAPAIAAVSMNCLRETPLSLSSIPPPFALVMIYLPAMKTMSYMLLTFALVAATGAPAAQTQTTGPWKSLFDGTSLDAWRIYKSDKAPKMCAGGETTACWEIKDGVLQKDGNANDLASKDQFGDFELELEWKIGEAGNSGIFYRGTEEEDHIYWTGLEYQLLDNIKASDNKRPDHLAGAAYEMYVPPDGHLKPVGEWNSTRIIAKGAHVEHWLNGFKLLEYELWSPDWEARMKASKFKDYPNFGRATRGHFGIQGDHEGDLAFRNIRVRELK